MTAKKNKSAPTLYRYLMDSGHSGGDRLLLEGVKHQCGAKGHARFWANSRLLGDNFQEVGIPEKCRSEPLAGRFRRLNLR
jgi:hypothetical protein